MTLKEQLQEDMKAAMKAKDQLKLSVIRLAKAAIMNQEIARGHEFQDQEVIEVLAKELKQRNDSIPEYEKAGRSDIVEKLKQEIKILEGYLPARLSEAEVRQLVEETIAEVGAISKKDMGKVMAALMPKTKGRADGKLVNQIVNSILQ
ncbi:MAG: GatB/YqeY domain-containing protein [Firmicutes bacterium]|nr:GatB/YqeY domain-containing protein [Bacillota bacterium]